MKEVVAMLLLALSLPAPAAPDIAGVKFDDKAKVGAGDTVINSAGLRKRVAIVPLRDLTAEQFADALIVALKNNHAEDL